MRTLAIDPGGVHVGMALFLDVECQTAWEMAPAEAIAELRDFILGGLIDKLVIEEFRLYPWLADTLSYSDFPTVQLIGALKLVWATNGGVDWSGSGAKTVELVMQPATIKKPTRQILKAKKVKSQAKIMKAGNHAADAELHGYHHLMRLPAPK